MAERVGYQGEIAGVRCGVGGLSVNLNPSQILLKNVIQAEGVVFRQDHWRKEPGTVLFGVNTHPSGADRQVVALFDYHPTDSVQRIVSLMGDGKVYYTNANPGNSGDPGANVFATQNSGSGTTFGLWVAGGQEAGTGSARKLFLFRSNEGLSVIHGDMTNFLAVSNPATDWISGGANAHPPICGVINGAAITTASGGGGRLVAAGNDNNPHMLYISRANNQEIFDDTDATVATNSQLLSVFPGVGQRIFALRNYQGFVVVFKYPKGIFLADLRDPDPTTGNWIVTQVSDQVGIAPSPYAALQLENDILFMGSDAQFYLLSAILSTSRGETPMALDNLGMDLQIYQFLLNAFNRNELANIQSVYQPFWQTAHWALAGPSSTNNDTRFLFEFNAVGRQGGEIRFSYSFRDKPSSLALHRDPDDQVDKPMFGDYLGDIILMEQEPRTAWDGANYPMRIQTPHSNFGEFESQFYDKFVAFTNRNKLWENIEFEYVPFTDATITVTVFVDGNFKARFPVHLFAGGKPLGFSDSDTAAFIIGDSLLAAGVVRSEVKTLKVGSGRRISFLIENLNPGEDIALTAFYVGLRVSDTTTTPRR